MHNYKSPCDRMSQVFGCSPSNMGYSQIRANFELFCDVFAYGLMKVVNTPEVRVVDGFERVFRPTLTVFA